MVLMWFWMGIKESSCDILLSLLVDLSLSWNTKLKNICFFFFFFLEKKMSPVFLHVNRFVYKFCVCKDFHKKLWTLASREFMYMFSTTVYLYLVCILCIVAVCTAAA
jgi:hypothetical protein